MNLHLFAWNYTLSPAVRLFSSSGCLFDSVWSAQDDRRVTADLTLPASSNVLGLHVFLSASTESTLFAATFLGKLMVSSGSSRNFGLFLQRCPENDNNEDGLVFWITFTPTTGLSMLKRERKLLLLGISGGKMFSALRLVICATRDPSYSEKFKLNLYKRAVRLFLVRRGAFNILAIYDSCVVTEVEPHVWIQRPLWPERSNNNSIVYALLYSKKLNGCE